MKETTKAILTELMERYPALAGSEKDIVAVYEILQSCFANGNRVYLCGNGGSAADCEHIAGELLKSFKKCRPLSNELVEGLKMQGEKGQVLLHGCYLVTWIFQKLYHRNVGMPTYFFAFVGYDKENVQFRRGGCDAAAVGTGYGALHAGCIGAWHL